MGRAFEIILLFSCLSVVLTTLERARLQFSGNDSNSVFRLRLGHNAVMECQASGIPNPVIYWQSNGARIAQAVPGGMDDLGDNYYENLFNSDETPLLKFSTTRSRLYVDCVTESKIGDYTCVAETPDKQIMKTFSLQFQDDWQIQNFQNVDCLKRLSSPSSVPVPARIYMWTVHRLEFEGATVQLFCRADGHPRPSISWIDRDGKPITDSANHKFKVLENGDLLIFNINWSTDMGQYKCMASSSNGQDVTEIFLYPTKP